MTRKSLDRKLWTIVAVALTAGMTASAQDLTPTGVPGNTLPGQQMLDHSPDSNDNPISSAPAAAGTNAVRPSFTRALQTRAHMPASAPVPPTDEIQILDPNVDPLGRPAVKVSPVIGTDGQARIDIPPAVLVHRYYYTGDRSFQGPMLPGGPTVVVFNHPADGERLYLEIQMPPGAPRVIYTRHSIEYNYGVQSVILSFGAHGKPSVTYRQGVSGMMKARVARKEARQAVDNFVARTGLPEARQKVHQQVKTAASSVADRIHDVGKAVAGPVIQIVKLIPGIKMLTSPPENAVENQRDAQVSRATTALNGLESSIPTVR